MVPRNRYSIIQTPNSQLSARPVYNILKYILVLYFLILNFNFFNIYAQEQFDFDVTEIEISDNGEKFVGKKRGTITTNDGVIINANEFEYDKIKNILKAKGNVTVNDEANDYIINSGGATGYGVRLLNQLIEDNYE